MIFDIMPFWAFSIACYADGECGKALIVAICGPLIVLLDDLLRQKRAVRGASEPT
jgi:hypothetical protein